MNSTAMDTIKALIEHKKYSAITEYANILHKKDNLIVTEYGGTDVRLYKDKDKVRLLCPKKMDTVMEGHVAAAIENGSVFDDADIIDTNATCIERLSVPYDAMINSGKDTPNNLKPMIAIVIGKMNNDGSFDVSDDARNTGTNFVRDLSDAKKNGEKINGVVNNYIEREPDGFYTPEMGKNITGLNREMDDINDTDPGDVVSDDDTVDSYDDIEIDDIEHDNGDEQPEDEEGPDVELGNETENDEDEVPEPEETPAEEEDNEESENKDADEEFSEDEEEEEKAEEVEECGENCNSGNKPIVQEEDEIEASAEAAEVNEAEQMGEDVGEAEAVEEGSCPLSKMLEAKVHQEGFFSKKPKKLKPINRDVVAYITVEMNAIHSANDQAMLAGYTCSKIELVDWYITVIDTQDPKYLVPHTRQYLVTMKAQLESLLAQILKIRPINRSEQIWRVNYPQAT